MQASVPFPLLWPMTFKGCSKGNGMEGYIGHVGAHFKALVISKSATRSVFTSTKVAITRKLFQCEKMLLTLGWKNSIFTQRRNGPSLVLTSGQN